jgi:hypothetical protein
MKLSVNILVGGAVKRRENLFLVGAKIFKLFTGDGLQEVEISDGMRTDKIPLSDGFNEIPFQNLEVIVYKEKTDKRGVYQFTLEMRKRKKQLTNMEKPTLLTVNTQDEPVTVERKNKRGLK